MKQFNMWHGHAWTLTRWHRQRIQSTAVAETDISKHFVCMCADLTDEQNSHSVQQRQLTHHYEHLEQFSFSAKIKHNTFETFSYKKII